MNYVVGSGPAGVSAAWALLARGAEVTLVETGFTIEPEREALVEKLAATKPEQWVSADVERIKEGMDPTEAGVVLKRIFGSDFPYRGTDEHLGTKYEGTGLRPSLARGGLSNVWGAAMLPYTAADMAGWPVTAQELAPHYAAVTKFTGLAGQRDDLEALFPLHHPDPAPLPMSRQARRLWSRLERYRSKLGTEGMHFGASRLAVRAARPPDIAGCICCGLCMYGCPWGYIYNSAATLREMRKNPRFHYTPGIVVTGVGEKENAVTLHGYREGSREPWQVTGDRAFLAAGVIPTTQLLLAARSLYERPVWIRDSQYFLFPLLSWQGEAGVEREALHTLSQIFLEILDPKVSPHTVHLQLYTYSDLIADGIRAALGPLGRRWLVQRLAERTMIAQGYLHSDHSGRIRMALQKSGEQVQVLLKAELNPETPRMVRRVLRKLLGQTMRLGMAPGIPQLQLTQPGRGYHSGGSLPMRAQPGELETDTLGRPHGWQRVHAVDATVLPTIPATTITFSVMANAHRIATAALA
jgi:choline dehydrogenase-like flavoprotein